MQPGTCAGENTPAWCGTRLGTCAAKTRQLGVACSPPRPQQKVRKLGVCYPGRGTRSVCIDAASPDHGAQRRTTGRAAHSPATAAYRSAPTFFESVCCELPACLVNMVLFIHCKRLFGRDCRFRPFSPRTLNARILLFSVTYGHKTETETRGRSSCPFARHHARRLRGRVSRVQDTSYELRHPCPRSIHFQVTPRNRRTSMGCRARCGCRRCTSR